MIKTREITLGDLTLVVPPLPLRYNREVYPLCVALTEGGLFDRWVKSGGTHRLDDDEFEGLCDVAFWLTQAAGAGLDRAQFDALPINQIHLMNAFLVARYQTGVWIETEPTAQDNDQEAPAGEATGTRAPRTKRSRA